MEKKKDKVELCVDDIKALDKIHGADVVRRACNRYYLRESEKKKLEREIRKKEKELKELKSRS